MKEEKGTTSRDNKNGHDQITNVLCVNTTNEWDFHRCTLNIMSDGSERST